MLTPVYFMLQNAQNAQSVPLVNDLYAYYVDSFSRESRVASSWSGLPKLSLSAGHDAQRVLGLVRKLHPKHAQRRALCL